MRVEATAVVVRGPRFLTASLVREMGILLVLAMGFPFLLHLLPVPENSQLGPRLLPMFWAPLLGCLWGRTTTAFAVAAIAPWLNWLFTRHPVPPVGMLMTIQLLVFVGTLRWLLAWPRVRSLAALPAYAAAMLVATGVVALLPELGRGTPPLAWVARATTMAWPGVVILGAINWLALRAYPPVDGGGPRAA
jgi:hypothetical protein